MASEHYLEASLFVAGVHGGRPRLDVTLRVEPGITLLWGPSGAGKTTCLLALAGLVRPQRGHVILDGRILFDAQRKICVATRARRLGLVFQTLALFPHLSVIENAGFGVERGVREVEARRWLNRMRVGHLERRRVATLSGGEAQRVALARVLASRPRLLLLDEPFSALDRELRRELSDELARVVSEYELPTLMVSHHEDDRLRWPGALIRLDPAQAQDASSFGQRVVANTTQPGETAWPTLRARE